LSNTSLLTTSSETKLKKFDTIDNQLYKKRTHLQRTRREDDDDDDVSDDGNEVDDSLENADFDTIDVDKIGSKEKFRTALSGNRCVQKRNLNRCRRIKVSEGTPSLGIFDISFLFSIEFEIRSKIKDGVG
jgi:hypothetical protein